MCRSLKRLELRRTLTIYLTRDADAVSVAVFQNTTPRSLPTIIRDDGNTQRLKWITPESIPSLRLPLRLPLRLALGQAQPRESAVDRGLPQAPLRGREAGPGFEIRVRFENSNVWVLRVAGTGCLGAAERDDPARAGDCRVTLRQRRVGTISIS